MALFLQVAAIRLPIMPRPIKTDFHRSSFRMRPHIQVSASSDSMRFKFAAEPRLFPNDSRSPSIALNARRVSCRTFFEHLPEAERFSAPSPGQAVGDGCDNVFEQSRFEHEHDLAQNEKMRVALIASGVFAASTTIESTLFARPESTPQKIQNGAVRAGAGASHTRTAKPQRVARARFAIGSATQSARHAQENLSNGLRHGLVMVYG